jgi:Zn-dependent peptidase ImmA (M78 family)/DNA-binding XRE family transcriptional regulator
MSRSNRALVNPHLLVWARKRSGFSLAEAAKKVGVKEERLVEWESGSRHPTVNQARKLAKVFKRPLAFFYLPEPPFDFDPMSLRDFRRLWTGEPVEMSPALRVAIREVHERRQIALELIEEIGEQPPEFKLNASLAEDPEQLGDRLRDRLDVSVEDQESWRNSYEALKNWIDAVERAGVLVFQISGVEVSEMRGFSLPSRTFPIVAVNGKDSANGRIFTLLHEFVHLLLGQEGVCDLEAEWRKSTDVPDLDEARRIEMFCNHVAGAALIPRQALASLVHGRDLTSPNRTLNDEAIRTIALKFKVSDETALRRATITGITSEEFYRFKREEFLETYAEMKKQSKGFLTPDKRAVRDFGRVYTSIVLDAYYEGYITLADVSGYLDIRLKHLPKVEDAIAS